MPNKVVHTPSMSGFTLIELIMVVVILGVLSAFAIPIFASMQADSRRASLDAVVASLHSASSMVAMTARVQNVVDGDIDYSGSTTRIRGGFVSGFAGRGMLRALDLDGSIATELTERCETNYCHHGNENEIPNIIQTPDGHGMMIWVDGTVLSDNCFAYYYNKEDGTRPLIGKLDTGC